MVHLWFAMLGDHDELFRPCTLDGDGEG